MVAAVAGLYGWSAWLRWRGPERLRLLWSRRGDAARRGGALSRRLRPRAAGSCAGPGGDRDREADGPRAADRGARGGEPAARGPVACRLRGVVLPPRAHDGGRERAAGRGRAGAGLQPRAGGRGRAGGGGDGGPGERRGGDRLPAAAGDGLDRGGAGRARADLARTVRGAGGACGREQPRRRGPLGPARGERAAGPGGGDGRRTGPVLVVVARDARAAGDDRGVPGVLAGARRPARARARAAARDRSDGARPRDVRGWDGADLAALAGAAGSASSGRGALRGPRDDQRLGRADLRTDLARGGGRLLQRRRLAAARCAVRGGPLPDAAHAGGARDRVAAARDTR